ncbi:MAG: hypothetical protein V4857_30200 [Pseudomonadota bacterium]
MSAYLPPPLIASALLKLQEYMHGFYPERARADPIPLDFWRIDDDGLFFEVLSYMPLHFHALAEAHFADLPLGFQLAFPIFSLEDDYDVNGWTALTNAGEAGLPAVIGAYTNIGMHTEAAALSAALRACVQDPLDDEAAEFAYKSVSNDYADDEVRHLALLAYFRANPQVWLASGITG